MFCIILAMCPFPVIYRASREVGWISRKTNGKNDTRDHKRVGRSGGGLVYRLRIHRAGGGSQQRYDRPRAEPLEVLGYLEKHGFKGRSITSLDGR
jgi:hypothetical protein